MHSIPFISIQRAGAIVLILLLAVCVPGLCVGIDGRLLTKDTSPTLTFGITPGYTLSNSSVTLSGGLYNFLVTLPGKEVIIERSVEYGPYEQIASVITGDDGTFLYLDTPPGRAEHKVYYRASYVEEGKRIIETEPIFLYLGTPETIRLQGNTDESDSNGHSQIREVSGYRFVIDSSLHDGERYLAVTVLVRTAMQGTISGILLASPCGDEFEMLAIGIPGSDGEIEFPAVEGCSEYYMLCPVADGEIISCTEPFTHIGEAEEDENTQRGGLGQQNSQILRDWITTSQFGDLLPETDLASEDEVTDQSNISDEISEPETSSIQIGTESLVLKLHQVQAAQRGISTPVQVFVTSMDEAPVSEAEITLFLSSDLAYWYRAAKSITNENGIAAFYVDAGRLATLKARAAFLGNERYAYGESNTIVIIT
ncbi:MAG: hypothetical protein FWF19_03870 [Euryarchaeota archaeon]|nr:hypothetical protein [Euryarchaeota archaeon]